ncbi:hypothetical protein [Saccharomonospora xinjiangensis]|nr:hypothetical protein [Saccharomonospora xinjiangensis]
MRKERAMRYLDIDPTQPEGGEGAERVSTGTPVSGVVANASFDDDDLEPTIVRGRE